MKWRTSFTHGRNRGKRYNYLLLRMVRLVRASGPMLEGPEWAVA